MYRNEIIHRTKILNTDVPSYPEDESYIDLCCADARLNFLNTTNNNKIKTTDYDSDQRMLGIQIQFPDSRDLHFKLTNSPPAYNYNITDWEKFTNELETNMFPIPNDLNLNNEEIDKFLTDMNNIIKQTIDTVVPKYKFKDSVLNYVTYRAKNLHKHKTFLLTQLRNLKTYHKKNHHEISYIKQLIKRTSKTRIKDKNRIKKCNQQTLAK